MTPSLAKFALMALALATALDIRRSLRRRNARLAKREALATWEDEGGAVHPPPL